MGTAWAPGRVNVIGDHTDYTGGLVLPMAIDLGTSVTWEAVGSQSASSTFTSTSDADVIDLADRTSARGWGRYVHAVADLVIEDIGHRPSIRARVDSTLPIGAGLSSSASLEVAVAMSLGAPVSTHAERVHLARLCQRAEQHAVGVPCGIMDQLIVLTGENDMAQLIDCHTLDEQSVPIPDDVQIVVRFIAHRTLAGSAYADRVDECAAAEALIGPLRRASTDDVARIGDDTLRRRAAHVVSENHRVSQFALAMRRGDYVTAGRLMSESHESLDTNYEVSNATMNKAVADLNHTPGVFGARMTGGGFGGCVVALASADATIEGWNVRASRGAHLTE